MPTPDTRGRILEAALDCFVDLGFEGTSVAEIRARGAVSNGALFHHFPNKSAIADALFLDAIQSVQEDVRDALQPTPTTLRDGVAAVIRTQLVWSEKNPKLAKFLYVRGDLDWSTPGGEELRALNEGVSEAYRAWLEPYLLSGEVRAFSVPTIIAILTGPAHTLTRRWLSSHLPKSLSAYADELIDAAVAGLSATPAAGKRSPTVAPPQARVRVQLVDEDGNVMWEGDTAAALSRPNI